jgi:hypothetical protein
MMATTPADSRIDWVDYAKGICIILVVMMHSTLGVAAATGEPNWLLGFIEWARPFRMPDFFLLSGLFLASRIDRPWRAYADTKIMHFAYFYLLWMTIQTALKGWSGPDGIWGVPQYWLTALVEPLGTLWFIYVLILFFVTAKLLRNVPVWIVLPVAAALELAPIHTGWIAVDEFAGRFVYFYTGYVAARWIMSFAAGVARVDVPSLLAFLATWAVVNLWAVQSGLAFMPVLSMLFGYAGCAAVITLAQLMSRTRVFEGRALLRGEHPAGLPRLFPVHGGNPCRSSQDRHHHRWRNRVADRHCRRHHRPARHALDRHPHAGAFPVRAPGVCQAHRQDRPACCRVADGRPAKACVKRHFRCWCEAGAGGIVPPP